jgi:outer membrane protein
MHAVAISLGAALGLAFASPASAQTNVRIGFVNVNAVLQMAPQTQEVNETLNAEFASREAELVARDEELRGKRERLDRDGAVMPQAERATLEREIATGQLALERDAAALQEDAQLRQQELVNELQSTIARRIQAFAVAEGYDLIVTNQGVVFASEAIDITEAVLRALSSGTAAGASTEAAPSTSDDTSDE